MRTRIRSLVVGAVVALVAVAVVFGSGHATDERTECPGGSGWTQLGAPSNSFPTIRKKNELLTVAGGWRTPGELWGGDWGGLHHSTDCGRSWELIRVPRSDNTYIRRSVSLVGSDALGGIYVAPSEETIRVTPDDGATWRFGSGYLASDAARPVQPLNPLDLAVSSGAEPVAYITVIERNLRGRRGLWRTVDGGRRWEERNPRSFIVWAIDPRDGDVVYGGSRGFLTRSTDGGGSFEPYSPLTCPDPIPAEGAIKALAITSDASRFWLATTTNEVCRSLDQGLTWHRLDDGPPGGPIKHLAVNPFDHRSFFAVTEELDLWIYREPDGAAPAQVPAE